MNDLTINHGWLKYDLEKWPIIEISADKLKPANFNRYSVLAFKDSFSIKPGIVLKTEQGNLILYGENGGIDLTGKKWQGEEIEIENVISLWEKTYPSAAKPAKTKPLNPSRFSRLLLHVSSGCKSIFSKQQNQTLKNNAYAAPYSQSPIRADISPLSASHIQSLDT